MELSCPSCGAKHETDDFPDAFEIQCACGYSILVPDLDSIGNTGVVSMNESGFSAAPAALDVEDEENKVEVESASSQEPLEDEIPRMPEGMTPPEDLPEEMPYDPFELPNTQQVQLEQQGGAQQEAIEEFNPISEEEYADDFSSPAFDHSDSLEDEEQASFHEEAREAFDSAEGLSAEQDFESLEAGESLDTQEDESTGEESSGEQQTPAQKIVERVQLASMGQLLGFSYDIEWAGVDEAALQEAKSRCLRLLNDRPWLESELKTREISIEDLSKKESLKNLPEPIALEIYMTCLEFGGRCHFRRSDDL